MLKWLKNLTGLVLLLIGLAGVPDDIKTWEQWINKHLNKTGFIMDLSSLNQDFYRWLFVILGIVFLCAWSNSARRLKVWKKRPSLKPTMKIEHKEDEQGYYIESPYLNNPIPLEELFDKNEKRSYWRTCRISIHNLSTEYKIKDVEVKLMNISPEQLRGRLPVHLHFTHDNTPPFSHRKNINPDDNIFVDIVQWVWDGQNLPFYIIQSTEDKVFTGFPADNRDYRIEIKVTAENAPSVSRIFTFGSRNKDNTINKIWLWPID